MLLIWFPVLSIMISSGRILLSVHSVLEHDSSSSTVITGIVDREILQKNYYNKYLCTVITLFKPCSFLVNVIKILIFGYFYKKINYISWTEIVYIKRFTFVDYALVNYYCFILFFTISHQILSCAYQWATTFAVEPCWGIWSYCCCLLRYFFTENKCHDEVNSAKQ